MDELKNYSERLWEEKVAHLRSTSLPPHMPQDKDGFAPLAPTLAALFLMEPDQPQE